jgi:hypothetical protein
MSETETPEAESAEPTDEAPSPADVAREAQEAKAARSDDGDEERKREHLQKLRSENKALRDRLKAADPILKAAQEAEEAKKGEAQREREAREQAERERDEERAGNKRLRLGLKYGIPEDRVHLIPQGSDEDMEANAAHLGGLYASTAKTAPPPSDRPVEGLRPGASPEPPKPEDNSYPPGWGRPRPRAS